MANDARTIDAILDDAMSAMQNGDAVPHCGTRQGDRDEVAWFQGYAGCLPELQPKAGVCLANWNEWPDSVTDELEAIDVDVEWIDEWQPCDDCGLLVRTSPDSFCYRALFSMWENRQDGSVFVCVDCLQEIAEAYRDDDDNDDDDNDESEG